MTKKRFRSRLRMRRQSQMCVTVRSRNTAGTESLVYEDIDATHTQKGAMEVNAEFGVVVANVVDIFWFEPLSTTGMLPIIQEKHLVYNQDGVKHEIIQVIDQGGEGGRLAVITERKR